MNSIERVLAVVNGEPTDRPPVSLLLSLYGARLTDCPLDTYYRDAAAYVRGQAAVRETFEPDILFAPFALALEGEAFGSRINFRPAQAPTLAEPVLSSVAELEKLEIPAVESSSQLLYLHETLRLLAAEHGRELPIAAIALSPIDLPVMLMGIEGWLETILFDKPAASAMLDMTIPYFVQRINDLFAAGAAFVVMPALFGNPTIVTNDALEELALPVLRKAFAQIKGPLIIHSGGVSLAPFLELFAGLPNMAGFVVNDSEDLQLARQKAGADAVLLGNLNGPELYRLSPEEIFSACRLLLRQQVDDRRFILGTSAADITLQTSQEQIQAICRAARSGEGRR